jgi:midasin
METVVKLLQMGKARSSQTENMQVVFILSDGRNLQNKETLKRWTREAETHNMFVVFLIIDSAEYSIAEIEAIEFLPDGKIKRTKALETFPFLYYVLLKDIHVLPHVLADALRQWFEMTKNTQ